MKLSRLLFGVLSAIFSALIYSLINEFVGFSFLTIFLAIFVFVFLWEVLTTGRLVVKAAFLACLSILVLINGGLVLGAFEAIDVSPTSLIDLSEGSIILRMHNSGLSQADIETLTVGEITYNFTRSEVDALKRGLPLGRGENTLLKIGYGRDIFEYGKTSSDYTSYSESHYEERIATTSSLTPLTFYSESAYSCVIRTRFREYHFLMERKPSLVENLDILQVEGTISVNRNAEITFRLNNTAQTDLYIYSVQIGSLTLKFAPFISIYPTFPEYNWTSEIRFFLYSSGQIRLLGPPNSRYFSNVQAEPTFDLSMLTVNGSYEITFWTLTNKMYHSTVTFTQRE